MATQKLELDHENIEIPDMLPVIPLRNTVVYPHSVIPLSIGRERSVKAVESSMEKDRLLFLVSQKEGTVENPTAQDLYRVGTVVQIMKLIRLPGGDLRVLVQGVSRAESLDFQDTPTCLLARLRRIHEPKKKGTALRTEALVKNAKESLEKATNLGKNVPQEIMIMLYNMTSPGASADLIAATLDLEVDKAQQLLETSDPLERLLEVNKKLSEEIELLAVQQEITSEALGQIDKSQRELFLRHQLKAIQEELGEGPELADDVQNFRQKIAAAKMPEEARNEAERELKKLEQMNAYSPQLSTVHDYLEWMVELPWSKSSRDKLNIERASKILDDDHASLEHVKDRVLEHLSVRKLKKDMKGPILCFVGPPGTGKTSMGRSIARALGRKFIRMSLGGVRDEAEIRGHRRTYIGALPGRIIQGIRNAGTKNPVFMLDEVDKIGLDYHGDPSSALLEVLDPEQNDTFRDHYLGVPFDLSNVLFLTTANLLDTIQPAFRDRMEIISFQGYTQEEKLKIAQGFLLPKQRKAHGLTAKQVSFSSGAIRRIISQYTSEAGVRNLERAIGKICRKVARSIAEAQRKSRKIRVDTLESLLGAPKISTRNRLEKDEVGVATGVAWTQSGGDILFVEATFVEGKGELTMTGQLGEVMKESARAALTFARKIAPEYGLKGSYFAEHDLHIHVPEGATPKDGPSAGTTMAVAVISACTNFPIRKDITLTGEITLRGKILPVGGIKHKILAAKRVGILDILLPAGNKPDVLEIEDHLLKGLQIHYVDSIDEVLDFALIRNGKQTGKKNIERVS